MEDQLKLCTLWLLTDYLEYCTQRLDSAVRPRLRPPVMCSIASQVQECYQLSWTCYRQCQSNHVEMVANAMQNIFQYPRGSNWGRVVAFMTFAGFLLETAGKPHMGTEGMECQHWPGLPEPGDLAVHLSHGAVLHLLEAQGSWDGFCHFFRATWSPWRKLLVWFLLSCLTLTIVTYLCRNWVAKFLTHFYLPTCDQPSEFEMCKNKAPSETFLPASLSGVLWW